MKKAKLLTTLSRSLDYLIIDFEKGNLILKYRKSVKEYTFYNFSGQQLKAFKKELKSSNGKSFFTKHQQEIKNHAVLKSVK